jgi:hypothetical protein
MVCSTNHCELHNTQLRFRLLEIIAWLPWIVDLYDRSGLVRQILNINATCDRFGKK